MNFKKMNFKDSKKYIRTFLREVYSDENLAQLLAHAQSGKLVYASCCCLIGLPTADHPLQSEVDFWDPEEDVVHYIKAKKLYSSYRAELAFSTLGDGEIEDDTRNELRRKRIIPIVRAEMRRRDRIKQEQEKKTDIVSDLVEVG